MEFAGLEFSKIRMQAFGFRAQFRSYAMQVVLYSRTIDF